MDVSRQYETILGRMHLVSYDERLTKEKFELKMSSLIELNCPEYREF